MRISGQQKRHESRARSQLHKRRHPGAKIKKSTGQRYDKEGNPYIREGGGVLAMPNPGGTVSEAFRDISRARNKQRLMEKAK